MKINAFVGSYSLKKGLIPVIVIVLGLISFSLFIFPLILSIDSVYGFFAYKGSIATGKFNVIREISYNNINKFDTQFVAWWSPGQWIFPGILNYIFGIKLGLACILTTIFFAISGLLGYYRLFKYFQFPTAAIQLSLLLIIASSTFYQNFIIYQGGEIISFGIFPWFTYFLVKLKKFSLAELVFLALAIILCFVAKTTMIIYCSILVLYRITENSRAGSTKILTWDLRKFVLILPLIVSVLIIYFFYIKMGVSPTLFIHFHLNANDLLVPLSSPLTGLFSLQTIISRVELGMSNYLGLSGKYSALIGYLLYTISAILSIYLIRKIFKSKQFDPSYKRIVGWLFAGTSLFFIVAYLFDTNIDYSIRHYKNLSFLFLPSIICILSEKRKSLLIAGTALIFTYFVVDFIYSRTNWVADRYISRNFFYRNFDNRLLVDKLDSKSYSKLLHITDTVGRGPSVQAIFCIEANPDIALDIEYPVIFIDNRQEFYNKSYHGNGPILYLFILKETLKVNPNFIKNKFPEYSEIVLIDETEKFKIFRSIQ